MTDCSVDTFKRCLDKYLRIVPDEPNISGYTALRRAESNSLFDMAQFASAQLVSTLEEPDQVSVARGDHPWLPWGINSRSHPQVSTSKYHCKLDATSVHLTFVTISRHSPDLVLHILLTRTIQPSSLLYFFLPLFLTSKISPGFDEFLCEAKITYLLAFNIIQWCFKCYSEFYGLVHSMFSSWYTEYLSIAIILKYTLDATGV